MTAPTGPLRPSLEEARELDRLRRRVADLEDQVAAARQTVEQQQTEFQAWRLRPTPRPARYTIRDVPTGGAL